ncbi:MAG TPA: hypothetical protein VHN37_00985, partial [Actinomycetota bacterium]|nr:hypothetical protein [Actinomycetota bacterium]
MRARNPILIALAAALVGGLVSAPATAAAAAPEYVAETVPYTIETRAGTLYGEVAHATVNGKIAKLPTILTLSPYSALGRNGDFERWVPKGYHRAWV